jgi:hypothetical protein
VIDRRLPYGVLGNSVGGAAAGLPPFPTLALGLGATSYWRMATVAGPVPDIAGANPLTVNGAPTRGVFPGGLTVGDDGAMRFPIAGDYASHVDNADLDLGDVFSIIMLLSRTVDTGGVEIILSKGLTSTALAFNAADQFALNLQGTGLIANETGTTPADGTWRFFGITRNGPGAGNTKVFKDGADVTNLFDAVSTFANTAADLWLARDVRGPDNDPPFHGGLDEVGLYRGIVLTPANMAALQAAR